MITVRPCNGVGDDPDDCLLLTDGKQEIARLTLAEAESLSSSMHEAVLHVACRLKGAQVVADFAHHMGLDETEARRFVASWSGHFDHPSDRKKGKQRAS